MSADIGQSVIDRIAATSEVKAICHANIYADCLEQGIKPPAVLVEVTDSACEEDLNSDNRTLAANVVVTAFGRNRTEANQLAKAIRDYALPANLRGSVHGMDFMDVSLVSGPAAMAARPEDGGTQWLRMTRQTFTIWASPT
jgi:hypothetical protein